MSYLVSAEMLAGEGLPSDGRALQLADLAEAYLERETGFSFRAQALAFALDGSGAETLTLPQPVLSLTSVTLDGSVLVEGTDFFAKKSRPPGPDDRRWPRLVMTASSATSIRAGVWTQGRQNVAVEGTFGFTRAQGAAEVPPAEIQRAALRLVAIEAARLGVDDEQTVRKLRVYLQAITPTSGMSATLSALAVSGGPTHVPEIDHVIERFKHPTFAAHPAFAFGGA